MLFDFTDKYGSSKLVAGENRLLTPGQLPAQREDFGTVPQSSTFGGVLSASYTWNILTNEKGKKQLWTPDIGSGKYRV
eukprot:11073385-Ditylum_brightwellii.AAC.1